MIKRLNFAEVIDSSVPSQACVSIYLPSVTAPSDLQERKSQINSLLTEVKALSAKSGSVASTKVIERLKESMEAFKDVRHSGGLAWFVSEKISGYIPVSWKKQPLAVLSSSFHVKPLFRDLQKKRPFWVLALSAKNIKLFHRHGKSLALVENRPVLTVGQPVDNFRESHPENRRRLRGQQLELANDLLAKYVSNPVEPVILAGSKVTVSSLLSGLARPFEEGMIVPCNPERISLSNLYKRALRLAAREFDHCEDRVLEEFRFCRKSRRALSDLDDIARAAVTGRIENLIIAEDTHVWGVLDRDTGSIEYHAKQRNSQDDDILDDLSELVYRYKGAVWVISKKKLGEESIYATLRW